MTDKRFFVEDDINARLANEGGLYLEPSHNIVIQADNGKKLTLDFNEGKLKTYGDLEYDEASKKFFDAFDSFFQGAINKWKKEFIRLLKEANPDEFVERGQFNEAYFKRFVNKLAGDNLI